MATADLEKLAATAARLREVVEDEEAKVWAVPTEIKADLPPAPAFDGPTLLPKVLCDFVLDEADRMPSSPDFVAVALICDRNCASAGVTVRDS